MPIQCEIISQGSPVFEGKADIVLMPAYEGQIGVLPNHAPMLSMLEPGVITVRGEHKEYVFIVSGGIVEIQPDQVTILADTAGNVEEIDIIRAEEEESRAEQQLETGIEEDVDQ